MMTLILTVTTCASVAAAVIFTSSWTLTLTFSFFASVLQCVVLIERNAQTAVIVHRHRHLRGTECLCCSIVREEKNSFITAKGDSGSRRQSRPRMMSFATFVQSGEKWWLFVICVRDFLEMEGRMDYMVLKMCKQMNGRYRLQWGMTPLIRLSDVGVSYRALHLQWVL